MNYELVNTIHPDVDNWKTQKERIDRDHSQVITLAPDPLFFQKLDDEQIEGINIIDNVTKRTFDKNSSLFFNRIPTVDGAEIFMNKGGSISVIKEGLEIGKLRVFPNTRRLARDLTYLNIDGSIDYVEEYAIDGKVYSNLYYYDNQINRMDFYNDNQETVLRYYFYEGNLNLVVILDPKTNKEVKRYSSVPEFMAAQVAKIVTENDTVNISYMGIELTSLKDTKSKNAVYVQEPAFDDNGNLKGNIQLIIENKINYIQEVYVYPKDFVKMAEMGLPMNKVRKM